ncbi:amino acid adenylation domain-containing protein [Actinoplanes sp. TBRC 11911]|uniref:amino acid adenylation domain-containing protein n=1 Tax=Actinoplanes sp. TBRC 11911 TaxID=2729386 RepID=UPI00145CAAF1|nr:amino acid adenylation domain-containing protein [Actinoplanes sp. TBRC 11911]NMO53362.1 amino acid adenylation domain-containing protein [Actinoplanes sp. TBRC 11911]
MTTNDARRFVPELADLPIVSEEAARASKWSLRRDHPVDVGETVTGHVLRFAETAPQDVAIAGPDETVTYRDLASRVAATEAALLAAGCRPGEVLASCGPRSAESVILLLAFESLGLTYLPVDAAWPAERLTGILARAHAGRVLHYGGPRPPDAGVPVIPFVVPAGGDPATLRRRCADPGEPRYVFYTSGTTGTPKGALNEHRGMMNHLWAKVLDLDLGPADVLGLTAPLTFDIAIWQMLAPLLVGGTVAVFDDRDMAFPRTLLARAERTGTTVLELVPTALEWLAGPAGRDRARALRCLVSTGEELGTPLAGRLLERFPGVTLVNAYGFTETSDDVTHHVVTPDDLDRPRLPVGTPVPNTVLYVLARDDRGMWRAVEPGELGELFVGGLAPGCGYLADERATAAGFFRDVLDPQSPTGRLYRSGDAVRVDGTVLSYVGRLDRQVKVSGVRMELGEIEAALRAHPAVADGAVVTAGEGDRKRLVAYYVPGDGPVPPEELRDFLSRALPAALVPRRWHLVDALPVTANGKIDHRRLAQLADQE